jgi:predicted component of type VI protein secretion system
MSAAKTTSERVQKLRADRDALGLKRLELYAHPEDWPAIKALAEKLQRRRSKKLESGAG